MNCELCGYPIRKDNVIGVCRSNIHCKREGMTRQRLRKKQGLVGSTSTCGSCGEPLRAGNQTGYCSANTGCNTERSRLYPNSVHTRDASARARAKAAGVAVSLPWNWEQDILPRSPACYICRQTFTGDDPAQADHVIPLDKGGWDWSLNIAAAHRSCNARKGNRISPLSLNAKAAAASMQLAAMLGYIGWKATNAA